ncbi:MAG: hypothetical protein SFU86_12340 [Pirellulaceae bacterium]|nr:hypothetical protein [Pirellulaceae bacterium]
MPAAPANRLGIAHLLLWTTATAIALAALGAVFPLPTAAMQEEMFLPLQLFRRMWLQRMIAFAAAPAYGAALAGIGLALFRLVRRQPGFPSQPGHWLLLYAGVYFIEIVGERWLKDWPLNQTLVGAVCMALVVGISLLAAWHVRQPLRWRIVFWMFAIAALWMATGMAIIQVVGMEVARDNLAWFYFMPAILLFAGLWGGPICGLIDLFAAEKRDVFHWTGVVVAMATILHGAALFLAAIYVAIS